MRKITIVILGLFAIHASFAQSTIGNRPGELMLSLGAGYSNLSSTSTIIGFNYGTAPQQTSTLPEFGGTLDYFILNNYAIGVNASYQSVKENGTYYVNYPSAIIPYTENIARFNIAIRSTIYFTKNKLPDFYGGLQIGYEYWYYNYTQGGPPQGSYGYYNYATPPSNAPTVQAFVGVRANITQDFSTYVELGTGVPFWVEMGFSIGLGGNIGTKVSSGSSGGIGDYGTPPPAPVNH